MKKAASAAATAIKNIPSKVAKKPGPLSRLWSELKTSVGTEVDNIKDSFQRGFQKAKDNAKDAFLKFGNHLRNALSKGFVALISKVGTDLLSPLLSEALELTNKF